MSRTWEQQAHQSEPNRSLGHPSDHTVTVRLKRRIDWVQLDAHTADYDHLIITPKERVRVAMIRHNNRPDHRTDTTT
jgi:hypothetical protein